MSTDAQARPLARGEPIGAKVRIIGAILVVVAAILVVAAVGVAIGVLPADLVGEIARSPLYVGHLVIAAAIVIGLVGLIYDHEGYLAGIWVVGTLFAWTAAAGTVVAYLIIDADTKGIEVRMSTVYLGLAVGLALVAAFAFLGRELGRPRRGQAKIWDSLCDRNSQLRARYDQICTSPAPNDPVRAQQNATMLAEAKSRFGMIETTLRDPDTPSLRWALATGYSSLQRTLHRIDEMIVEAQPDYAVTGDALHDTLSLSDSTIANSDILLIRLRTAVQAISPNTATSFFPIRGAPEAPPPGPLPTPAEAREVLREVRFAVNDFRDDRVDGIILARNRLLLVVITVGITAFFTLALAVLAGVDRATLISVSALYLVAALAGLINRLRIESGRSSAVEDYGLNIARLIATPLLSGLAGVAGVFLVATTPELLNVVAPTANGQNPPPIDVSEVFNLAANQSALLVAAVFGLVPAQLFSGLQRQADRFQVDLEKSEPSGGSTLSSNSA